MVKKALKRILSMGCVAALFMTTSGTTLMANDLWEDDSEPLYLYQSFQL